MATRPSRLRWIVVVIAILAVAALFVHKDSDGATVRHGKALSASGVISVEVDGSVGYSIPLDVAWVDADGSYHPDGRPECLPPVGIGTST